MPLRVQTIKAMRNIRHELQLLEAKILIRKVLHDNPVNGPAMLEQIEAEALGLA